MGDVSWLAVAFVMGYLAHLVKLPPLIGFLCAGFVLNGMGFTGGEMLNVLSDLGVTLLLFAVGLKLDIKSLAKPQIWGVTSLHMVITIALISGILLLLKFAGLPMLMELPLSSMVLIAFALSFSSTVFAVKILEEKFEMASMHGKIAIGILVMQDLFAVLFLAASEGKMPAWYAPLLIVGLFLIKPLLFRVLKTVGYGELLILFALVIAIGGSTLFEMVGIKDDLGSLFIGVLVASHSKAKEMAKSIMSFKDIFLVGFFLTIGLAGTPTMAVFSIALLILPLILGKSLLFFWLMTRMKVRARPAFLATLSLSNYSEFGLIVAALGASQGWISSDWLIIIALALSLSFIVLAPLCRKDHGLYDRLHEHLLKHQRAERMPEDQMHDSSGAQLAVIGMGRVGTGAYDALREVHGDCVVGIDFDQRSVDKHLELGRNAIRGNPAEADFWDTFVRPPKFEWVLITLPLGEIGLEVIERVRKQDKTIKIAATARYPKDEEILKEAGIDEVFNMYTNAGLSFVQYIMSQNEIKTPHSEQTSV